MVPGEQYFVGSLNSDIWKPTDLHRPSQTSPGSKLKLPTRISKSKWIILRPFWDLSMYIYLYLSICCWGMNNVYNHIVFD